MKEDIVNHFKERSESYDKMVTSWIHNPDILGRIWSFLSKDSYQELDRLKVLEVGAGTGVVSKYLLNKSDGKMSITALDISEDMLKKINDNRVEICVSNAEAMPFGDNTFDIVVSRQCLHYVINIDVAIEEIRRVLKPKGKFVLSQIVPYSDATKEYWKKIIEFRQPLRKHYFSETDWIKIIERHGLATDERYMCFHIASLNNWIRKYNIIDTQQINHYRNLYIHAPKYFKYQYDVKISNSDVISKSFWTNILFINNK